MRKRLENHMRTSYTRTASHNAQKKLFYTSTLTVCETHAPSDTQIDRETVADRPIRGPATIARRPWTHHAYTTLAPVMRAPPCA